MDVRPSFKTFPPVLPGIASENPRVHQTWSREKIGGDVDCVEESCDKAEFADPPHAAVSSMMMIIDLEEKKNQHKLVLDQIIARDISASWL